MTAAPRRRKVLDFEHEKKVLAVAKKIAGPCPRHGVKNWYIEHEGGRATAAVCRLCFREAIKAYQAKKGGI